MRRCSQCRLNIYNISELSHRQTKDLVRTHEGRTVNAVFRRTDATITTTDCPASHYTVKRCVRMAALLAVTAVSLVLGVACIGERHSNPFRGIRIVDKGLSLFENDSAVWGRGYGFED
jgi:hypothetical protein